MVTESKASAWTVSPRFSCSATELKHTLGNSIQHSTTMQYLIQQHCSIFTVVVSGTAEPPPCVSPRGMPGFSPPPAPPGCWRTAPYGTAGCPGCWSSTPWTQTGRWWLLMVSGVRDYRCLNLHQKAQRCIITCFYLPRYVKGAISHVWEAFHTTWYEIQQILFLSVVLHCCLICSCIKGTVESSDVGLSDVLIIRPSALWRGSVALLSCTISKT